MGCVNPQSQTNFETANSLTELPYAICKVQYKKAHEETLNSCLSSEFCEEIRLAEDVRLNSLNRIEQIVKKYHSKVNKKLNTKGFRNLIHELIGENLIKKYFLVPSIDIFKTTKNIFSTLGFEEGDLKGWKIAIEPFEKEFEMDYKGIVYNITQDIRTLAQCQFQGINTTLKFHPDFQVGIFTIILNQNFFKLPQVAYDVAQILFHSKSIKIVNLIINPLDENGKLIETFGFDGAYYKILYKLFEAISENRTIKGLFFHSMKNYHTMIAPEISTLLIKKMQSETLLAMHFGNIHFSSNFYQKLMFQIVSTRSLLFLSLHGEGLGRFLNDKILPSLIRNTSLVAVSMTGLQKTESENTEKFKKEIKEKNKKINLVYCGEKSFITLPFKFAPNK